MTTRAMASGAPSHELKLRVASAVVMIVAALVTLLSGGLLFDLFWTAAAIVVWTEWVRLTPVDLKAWRTGLGGLALLSMGVAAGPMDWTVGLVLSGAAGLAVQVAIGRGGGMAGRAWAAGGLVYAAVIVAGLVLVRAVPVVGPWAVGWMFAVIWSTDIAAFFTGRTFGGPRLWPRVSPKKTWSGFCGGTVVGTLAGLAVAWLGASLTGLMPIGWVTLTVLSVLASVLGQFGDLAESALKRQAGVKDSGNIIPGHGGAMDRLDGFWAAAFIGLVAVAANGAFPG